MILTDCKIIGSGAYGRVYVGTYNGRKYAVKRRYVQNDPKVPPGCVHVNEIDVMCRIKHPHILHAIEMQQTNPLSDSFRTDKLNPAGEKVQNVSFRADMVYLISDAADGDLSMIAISEEPVVQESDSEGIRVKDELRRYMWQILTAIAYLHAQGYIHRDIKPNNILFFGIPDTNIKGGIRRDIKICDFDMCLPNLECYQTTKAMTPEYTPPEVLTQGENVSYTPKVDIWGAGNVMYHLIKGEPIINREHKRGADLDNYILAVEKHLFPNGNSIQMDSHMEEIVRNFIENDISDMKISFDLGDPEVNDLLLHMLDCDPNTRWSAIQCLEHPFFQKMEISRDHFPRKDNLFDDFIVEKHHMTDEMLKVFDTEMLTLSDNEYYGFFLGLDILTRVCIKKYRGNGTKLAICCFNLGMKFFYKETARSIPLDADDVKRIEWNIISDKLDGKIYRDNAYNHICRQEKLVYKYITANDLLGQKLSNIIRAIELRLNE